MASRLQGEIEVRDYIVLDLDFYNGKILFDDLKLDRKIPLNVQIDLLKEDLLQVNYNNKYIIDVGWYPEFDENGRFKVYVIEDFDWENPKMTKESKEIEKLISHIEDCITYVRDNMKYIYFEFEKEKFWIELGLDGVALRQIIINSENKVQISCFEDCLAEGSIEIEELETCCPIENISLLEFQKVWNQYTSSQRMRWKKITEKMKIGELIEGKVIYKYPQGWIIQVNDLLAIHDGDLDLKIGQIVSGNICGYDEENMWLLMCNKSH